MGDYRQTVMTQATKRILFLSNGHGEDNHSSHVVQTLQEQCPSLQLAAMPIVGQGHAYRRLHLEIIGPTQTIPSGGFTYMNRFLLLKDIAAGLIGLTWRQLQAVLRYSRNCDLIMATGDVVSQSFAYLTGKPYVSFISCLSGLYEGRLYLGPFISCALRSPRCLAIVTRDPFTATDLQRQGLKKAVFGGIPSLDRLQPTGKDLGVKPGMPMIALLPGSRMPEATRNFSLQLQLVVEIAQRMPGIAFRAALVPDLMQHLPDIAAAQGWQYQPGCLSYKSGSADEDLVQVWCYSDAFSDILVQSTLVIGMAGLAVDQAVAIGKPVIMIAGQGPQFTYAFAEAQERLLGISAQTIGKKPATPEILREAAQRTVETLQDKTYLAACRENGRQRLGPAGASIRIANILLTYLGEPLIPDPIRELPSQHEKPI
jgi:uncharacterized protein (TIGR03492 family)